LNFEKDRAGSRDEYHYRFAMLVGALQSHETFAVRFVATVRNRSFKNEPSIDPSLDAFPNGKHPDHIPLSSFSLSV